MNPEENNGVAPGTTPDAAGPDPVNNPDNTTPKTGDIDPSAAPEKDNDDDEEEEVPIEPAKPVPGSIGSALQYDENAPNHVSKVQKPPFEWTKQRIVAAVAIGVAVLIIAIVATIIIINSKNKPAKQDDGGNMVVSAETKLVTCTREDYTSIATNYTFTSEEYGRIEPISTTEKFRAVYEDGEPYDVAYTLAVVFQEDQQAITAIDIAKDIYKDSLKTKNLKEDPFTSTYSSNGQTLMVSRYSLVENININNAELLGIGSTKGEVAMSIDQISQKFISKGYTCEVTDGDQ